MKVDIGIQELLIELIDEGCPALRDMSVAKQFPNHGTVFAFCQRVIPQGQASRSLL